MVFVLQMGLSLTHSAYSKLETLALTKSQQARKEDRKTLCGMIMDQGREEGNQGKRKKRTREGKGREREGERNKESKNE